MLRPTNQIGGDPFQGLTIKQCEVLDLLIEHRTSKEISRILGISPHTVDQRILLARGKLHVASRSEVAQAYRRLLSDRGKTSETDIYHQSIYGSSQVATALETGHDEWREGTETASAQVRPAEPELIGLLPQHSANALTVDRSQSYHHVLPEAFDGRVGTLLRLGAIAMITVFLTLVILGGLAMYSELSHMLDG